LAETVRRGAMSGRTASVEEGPVPLRLRLWGVALRGRVGMWLASNSTCWLWEGCVLLTTEVGRTGEGMGLRGLLLLSALNGGGNRKSPKAKGLLGCDAYAGGGGVSVAGDKCGINEPRANEEGCRFKRGSVWIGLSNLELCFALGLSCVEKRSRERTCSQERRLLLSSSICIPGEGGCSASLVRVRSEAAARARRLRNRGYRKKHMKLMKRSMLMTRAVTLMVFIGWTRTRIISPLTVGPTSRIKGPPNSE